MIQYLMTWKWFKDPGLIQTSYDLMFRVDALPMLIINEGEILGVGSEYAAGVPVFASDRDALLYMSKLSMRDLQYRGMRDEHVGCFEQKQHANFLLYRRVMQCDSDAGYECLR